jgi:hypothetical protein
MPEYRAYILGSDGHFLDAVELTCHDDEAAIKQAATLVDGHNIELWQLDRQIIKCNHTRKNHSPEPKTARKEGCLDRRGE